MKRALTVLLLASRLSAAPSAWEELKTIAHDPVAAPSVAGVPQETELTLVSSSDPADPKFTVGQIFVPCSFGDHATRCLLDSGAGISLVKEADFSSGYRIVDIGFLGGAAGQPMVVPIVAVPRFGLGGAGLGPQNFVRYPDGKGCGGEGLFASQSEGLLGMDVLFPDRLELSFGSKAALRLDGPASGAGPGNPLTISKERKLSIPVVLGRTAAVALWDTGYGLSAVDQAYVASHPGEFSAAGEIDSYDISCAKSHIKVYKAKALAIGGQSFADEYVTSEDFTHIKEIVGSQDVRMVVGYNLISQLDWSMDFKGRRWSVKRSAPAAWTGVLAAQSSGAARPALRRVPALSWRH